MIVVISIKPPAPQPPPVVEKVEITLTHKEAQNLKAIMDHLVGKSYYQIRDTLGFDPARTPPTYDLCGTVDTLSAALSELPRK